MPGVFLVAECQIAWADPPPRYTLKAAGVLHKKDPPPRYTLKAAGVLHKKETSFLPQLQLWGVTELMTSSRTLKLSYSTGSRIPSAGVNLS